MKTNRFSMLASSLALTLLAGAVSAQTVTLRVADSFPVGHFIPKGATLPFIDEITRRTNGQVKFEYFPAQQLGKAADLLNLTQSGVADIGYVGVSYVSDKMPLSAVAQLPGSFTTACEGSLSYWELARGDTMTRHEFSANKVRLLFAVVLEPYQFYSRDREIRSIADVKGLKLRSTGGAMDIFARKIGAVPVRMAAPDVRESLSRGTLDGLIFPNESVLSYDLQKLVRFGTKGGNFGSFVGTYVIGESGWKKIPKDVQQMMLEVGDKVTRSLCRDIDASVDAAQGKLEQAGVRYHSLTVADRKPFEELSEEVAREWADGLDKRGKPGTQVLNEFKAALQKVRR